MPANIIAAKEADQPEKHIGENDLAFGMMPALNGLNHKANIGSSVAAVARKFQLGALISYVGTRSRPSRQKHSALAGLFYAAARRSSR